MFCHVKFVTQECFQSLLKFLLAHYFIICENLYFCTTRVRYDSSADFELPCLGLEIQQSQNKH